jgi:hypothetical protein
LLDQNYVSPQALNLTESELIYRGGSFDLYRLSPAALETSAKTMPNEARL